MVLNFVDDGLVLQDLAVVGKVDGLGLLGENGDLAASIVIALLEGLERRSGLAAKAKRVGHFGPVELESGATLLVLRIEAISFMMYTGHTDTDTGDGVEKLGSKILNTIEWPGQLTGAAIAIVGLGLVSGERSLSFRRANLTLPERRGCCSLPNRSRDSLRRKPGGEAQIRQAF